MGKNEEAALELTLLAIRRFQEIGLNVNPCKSSAICIIEGKLTEQQLNIDDACKIDSITLEDEIKDLGVTHNDSSVFYSNKVMTNHKKRYIDFYPSA